MDLIEPIVQHLVTTRYEQIPIDAREQAKKAIIDTLGTLLAGSAKEGCPIVAEQVREWGGKPESTLMVYGGRVPAPFAALANGMMARAVDLDDVSEVAWCHPDVSLVPAAFAIAQRRGNVDGKLMITAVALGQDLITRLGRALKIKTLVSGRHNLFKIFGLTASTAKLLELDQTRMHSAMGLAYALTTGVELQGVDDGSVNLRFRQGALSQAAATAALFAESGLRGARNVLQGRYGFYTIFEPENDLSQVTEGLGERFEGVTISFKPFSCCRSNHSSVQATIDLVKTHDLVPEEIQSIHVRVARPPFEFLCLPAEVKTNPRNVIECQFSLYYCVATAAIKRDVFLDSFDDNGIWDPVVRDLMKRVSFEPDDALPRYGAVATITTSRGSFTTTLAFPPGNPQNPLHLSDLVDKFRKCSRYSARPISEDNLARVVEMVTNLEQVSDVGEIPNLLVGS